MNLQNRFAYTPKSIVTFLESTGYFHGGCTSLLSLVEEDEIQCVEYYLDWEIQLEPFFAVAHTPTGHFWMPWGDAPESAELIKRIIRAGSVVNLERSLGGAE